MTKEEARREMDRITHGPFGLRVSFTNAERERLDQLTGIAFADDPVAPTQGVRLDGKEFIPTASNSRDDFLPQDIAAIVGETNPVLRQNNARALQARVLSATAMKDHPYWNGASGEHRAWQHGMALISRIAVGE